MKGVYGKVNSSVAAVVISSKSSVLFVLCFEEISMLMSFFASGLTQFHVISHQTRSN